MNRESPRPTEDGPADERAAEFEQQAARRQSGLASEFWSFLRHNKKWWLTPIVVMLLLFGLLIALGATGAAPFIYTLF